jgi:hypothetical protein
MRFSKAAFGYAFLLTAIFHYSSAWAQSSGKAESLRPNVVRVLRGGNGEMGFGFIVGSDASGLLVVTADHIVATDPTAGAQTVLVAFFTAIFKI